MADLVATGPAPLNLIGGARVPAASAGTYERHNPARPSELLGEFPDSGPADVEAAATAFAGWARRPRSP